MFCFMMCSRCSSRIERHRNSMNGFPRPNSCGGGRLMCTGEGAGGCGVSHWFSPSVGAASWSPVPEDGGHCEVGLEERREGAETDLVTPRKCGGLMSGSSSQKSFSSSSTSVLGLTWGEARTENM
ncbi:hypothetical protein FKM82_012979 [Ascaphus truei]